MGCLLHKMCVTLQMFHTNVLLQSPDQRHVIHEVVANEMENRIECSKGSGNSSHGSMNSNSKRVPFSSRHTRNRTMRAAVASVFPEADLGNFKELSAEETIHLGLEREFLRFDESGVST